MNVKKEYLSPCGMYCSVCAVRAADRDDDRELKEKLAPIFGIKPEQVACDGCRSEKAFPFALACAIRACANEKRLEACHQCGDFPCNHVSAFPFEISRQAMLAAMPRWKELGTEQWVKETEKRFTCPHCGALLHRYAQQCNHCQKPFA
ncbi:MAG: DUF3795 domain-containing protein [Candidatus Aminicenantes bacterium]|nr:DUF3795 domain-containing protein [Candidatus Aminicenantes bacterium]